MATCTTNIDFGRFLAVSWASGCGSDDQTALSYKPIGVTQSKSLDESSTEVDVTNDDSEAEMDTAITRMTAEITVSGFNSLSDNVTTSQKELRAYRRTEIAAGRQPTLWLKFVEQNGLDNIFVFVTFPGNGRTYGTDDANTGEFSFKMVSTGVIGKRSWIEVAKV